MFDDIIDIENNTCEECWWSITQGHNPISEIGNVYCNLNKRDYRKEHTCGSWRHRTTRSELKLKVNVKVCHV